MHWGHWSRPESLASLDWFLGSLGALIGFGLIGAQAWRRRNQVLAIAACICAFVALLYAGMSVGSLGHLLS